MTESKKQMKIFEYVQKLISLSYKPITLDLSNTGINAIGLNLIKKLCSVFEKCGHEMKIKKINLSGNDTIGTEELKIVGELIEDFPDFFPNTEIQLNDTTGLIGNSSIDQIDL